jgi:His-Xaa-Ser system protein HxsD
MTISPIPTSPQIHNIEVNGVVPLNLRFSKEIYPKVALIKSAYAFTDRAYIHLDSDDQYYIVCISEKPHCAKIAEEEFVNEMLCQCVRHEVYQQTRTIRELLAARALDSTLIERPPNTEEVLQVPVDDQAQIFKDWFQVYDDAETQKRNL